MSWLSDVFDSAGGAIGNIVGGVTSLIGGENTNSTAKEIASQNNATSIELANTAHQREVADLKAAGLNPILSAGGSGSAVPAMQAAPIQNTMTGLSNSAQSMASTIADVSTKLATVDNISADTANKRVNNALLTNQVTGADIANKTNAINLAYQQPIKHSEAENARTSVTTNYANMEKSMIDVSRGKIGQQLDQLAVHSAQAAANRSDIDSSYYLTAAGQFLRRLQLGGQAASDIVSPVGSVFRLGR